MRWRGFPRRSMRRNLPWPARVAPPSAAGDNSPMAAQQARDIEETDAAILSSELPIEAYLDRGFQAWLKRSEP
ncbi:MAG: DUF3619 family protein [Betaproteobacteria bacterium]|nr:MAG: DUF3619 family protein [Betaproteobacteria bacterium]